MKIFYRYDKETSNLYNNYKDMFQEFEMISSLSGIKIEYRFLSKEIKRETLSILIHNAEFESIEMTDYSDCGFIKVFISPERNEQIKNKKSFPLKPKKKDDYIYYYANVPLNLFESFFLNLYVGYDYKN